MHDDVPDWKLYQDYPSFRRKTRAHHWMSSEKACDAELWCFLCCWLNKLMHAVVLSVISDVITLTWRHRNVSYVSSHGVIMKCCSPCLNFPCARMPAIIPWICYERNFSEFYLSIWNQLVFNQRLQLFVQSPQPYVLVFSMKKVNVFSQHIGKKTNEYLNSAEQITRNWNVDQLSVLITSWDII